LLKSGEYAHPRNANLIFEIPKKPNSSGFVLFAMKHLIDTKTLDYRNAQNQLNLWGYYQAFAQAFHADK